jgi:hypothetical protein
MFYYQDTGKVSRPNEAQRKVVTKIRQVTYYNDPVNPSVEEPVVSYGTEIVEEVAVSPGYTGSPVVVGRKTIDRRNPNRVVKREFTKKTKED